MDKNMILKLLLVCVICLGLITGAVFLGQWLMSSSWGLVLNVESTQ